jgi:hypothetical protein
MEITCNRCHQALEEGSTFCPMCGLPQLVYEVDASSGALPPERRAEPVRDASTVAWKPAMGVAIRLAVPAGIIFAAFYQYSIVNDTGFLGLLFLMAAAAAWVVALYVRSQRPAWITIGAGARIGLVTGILSTWTCAAICGLLLFAGRYWFNYGKTVDDSWTTMVKGPAAAQWSAAGVDAQTISQWEAMLLSPQGRAGSGLSAVFILSVALLMFAVAGGALGARFLARPGRPQA